MEGSGGVGVASFEGSGTAFVDLRVRVMGCLRGEGLGAGSFVETLERVDLFATVGFLAGVDFLLGVSSDDGVGRPAEGSLSGISLAPERVVRDLVVTVGVFLAVVVAMVALGAEGGLRRRIGRGIAMARKLMLDGRSVRMTSYV